MGSDSEHYAPWRHLKCHPNAVAVVRQMSFRPRSVRSRDINQADRVKNLVDSYFLLTPSRQEITGNPNPNDTTDDATIRSQDNQVKGTCLWSAGAEAPTRSLRCNRSAQRRRSKSASATSNRPESLLFVNAKGPSPQSGVPDRTRPRVRG